MAKSNLQNGSSGSSGMNGMGNNPGSNLSTVSTNLGPSSYNPSTASTSSVSLNNQPSAMQSNSMGSVSGGSGLADLYRIQIEIGDLDNNISLLKDQLNTLTAVFNSYLNRPATSAVSLPDTLKSDILSVSLLAVYDSILTNNPMLGMLHYEQKSLDARKNMVSRMGYPMVGLGINYSLINKSNMTVSSMNGKDMIMPMVTVTMPIYRKKYKAMQNETYLMNLATQQGYKATANSLQTEYYKALAFYQDAERRKELYAHQSLLAQKSLNIMIASFSASGASLTDILQIRQQTLDYEVKQVEALTDYNTAIAWFKRLMANMKTQ
jgi:outer membrane protein TolC